MPRWRRKSFASPHAGRRDAPFASVYSVRHRSSIRDAPTCLAQAPRSSFRGRAARSPGSHPTAILAAPWIPGSRRFVSRPGMTRVICPTGKSAKSCPPPVAKIYRFAFDPKHLYKPRRLAPSQRGVSWSSRNVGAGCDGRRRYRRRTVPMRTAKPCGPGARRWRQVCGEQPAGDGGKQARSPGRARNKP